MVYRAMRSLHLSNQMWSRNIEVFQAQNNRMRMHWWLCSQEQAKAGVPAMQQLVTEVIKSRLKG